MDQVKIGKFIACRRKEANLTQLQLGDKLGITDRAVSKWETGKALPDASLMLELCAVLDITVNDLLSGEVVTMDDYKQELENKLIEMVREKENNDRRLLILEWVIAILSVIVICVPVILSFFLSLEEWKKELVACVGLIPGLVGLCFAVRIEQIAGCYECGNCKYQYVPTYKDVSLAPHMGRTRYMKCPHCGNKTWQQKRIRKEP